MKVLLQREEDRHTLEKKVNLSFTATSYQQHFLWKDVYFAIRARETYSPSEDQAAEASRSR